MGGTKVKKHFMFVKMPRGITYSSDLKSKIVEACKGGIKQSAVVCKQIGCMQNIKEL